SLPGPRLEWDPTSDGSLSKSRPRNRRAPTGRRRFRGTAKRRPCACAGGAERPSRRDVPGYGGCVFAPKSIAPFAKPVHARGRIAQPPGSRPGGGTDRKRKADSVDGGVGFFLFGCLA